MTDNRESAPRHGASNHVVHFELIGPDPALLRQFYASLFGWNATPGSPVSPAISSVEQYSFIKTEASWEAAAGGIGGGMGYDAHAIFYVGVDDVDDALRLAESLGAQIVLAPQLNEHGQVRVGHFRDPAGNLVGVAGP